MLQPELQKALDEQIEKVGLGAAVALMYNQLGIAYLQQLPLPDVLDVYEESPNGSQSERDAATILHAAKLTATDIGKFLERAEKPKAFMLIVKLMGEKGISAATSVIGKGLRRFGSFLNRLAGSDTLAADATMKLAWDANTIQELVEVLRLTLQVPNLPAHSIVQKKLRQHTWEDLFNAIQLTVISSDICNELVLAAADRATTKGQATKLLEYTKPKSATRAAVLAKAATLPDDTK